MSILARVIVAAVAGITLFSPPAYSASADKQTPVAQVYAVQGKASVKNSSGGSAREIEKGALVGADDALILEDQAAVSLYFKTGGKKEVRAKDAQTVYKIADLIPKPQAYAGSVPVFGASRGGEGAEPGSQTTGFFFPQEAVILESSPVIEFALFHGRGEKIALNSTAVQVVHNGTVLDSRKFDSPEYGLVYVYQPPKLKGQTEYSAELRFELAQNPGNVLTVSFPLYIAAASDMASKSKYGIFSDPVYRSYESASIDHHNTRRTVTLIKQLIKRNGSSQPVIAVELFIP